MNARACAIVVDLIPEASRYVVTGTCGEVINIGVSEVLAKDLIPAMACSDFRTQVMLLFGPGGTRGAPKYLGRDEEGNFLVDADAVGAAAPWVPLPGVPLDEQLSGSRGTVERKWLARQEAEARRRQRTVATSDSADDDADPGETMPARVKADFGEARGGPRR